MKVLITGAAGFIGSNVCERLLKENHKVIGIDNFDTYYDPKIKKNNIKLLQKYNNFIFYEVSTLNFKLLEEIFSKQNPEKVVHLAAKVGVRPSMTNQLEYEEVNIHGTKNLLELSSKFKIKNFVFASSSSVYGLANVPFNEKMLPNPISVYASTKIKGELLCKEYSNKYGLKTICLRFFTVYGPRGRPDMAIYKFTKLIDENKELDLYGDGSSKRDYTYVEDVVSGIILALNKDFQFEIFNIGDSNPIRLRHLIALIEKQLGKKAKIKHMPIQPGDAIITYADISHSRKKLGYNPKTKIEEGIKKFVLWYEAQKAKHEL